MQEVINFIDDAWRTLSESFAIKAILAVIAERYIFLG